jgi:hypothetical protein
MSHSSVTETEEHEPLAKALKPWRPQMTADLAAGQRPSRADRVGLTVWQTLPACPDHQTSTNLLDQSGSGEFRITRLSDQVVNDPKRRGLAITYVARFGPTLETTLRALDAAGTPENVKAFGRRPPNTRRWPSKRPASETFHRSCRSSDLLRSGMQFPPARSATIESTRSQTVVV